MAKFLPVFGEALTLVESGVKLIGAGVTAPFNKEAAGKLLHSAGDAWVGYAHENALLCLVRGDGQGLKKGADGFSKACPGVAHVRGFVHLARGENAEAYDCMANGTKAVGVIAVTVGVTAGTGGLATGPALAAVGASAAGTQVALDVVDTGIRSAHDGELVTAGTIRGVEQAIKTGDAVHIADAIVAPCQTAALAAGGAAVARAARAGVTPAQAENLAGTGQAPEGPAWQPNPALTHENVAQLPNGPRVSGANPAPSAAPSAVPSSVPTTGYAGMSEASSISTVSEAYSEATAARLLQENPVTLTEMRQGRLYPTRPLQHAFTRHIRQLAPQDARGALPFDWSIANGLRFGEWLQQEIANSTLYDVTYRGLEGHRAFFHGATRTAIIVEVTQYGGMDLVAAFRLGNQQIANLLGQAGRVH